jgi:hypothetical protein
MFPSHDPWACSVKGDRSPARSPSCRRSGSCLKLFLVEDKRRRRKVSNVVDAATSASVIGEVKHLFLLRF